MIAPPGPKRKTFGNKPLYRACQLKNKYIINKIETNIKNNFQQSTILLVLVPMSPVILLWIVIMYFTLPNVLVVYLLCTYPSST